MWAGCGRTMRVLRRRRRGAGEGGGLDGSGVAGEGGFGVNRGVAERAGSRRRQKMGVEVQFGGVRSTVFAGIS